ncbi:MAG TPA: hypothetical protein VGM25_09565 [Caulobacteraceae bacterium]|jgi:hypothetical protein
MRRALHAVAAAAFVTLSAGAASAQTGLPAPKPWAEPTKDPRDLNGVYMPESNSFTYTPVGGGDPPWTEAAHADFLHRRQAEKDGKPVVNTSTLCLPSGMPRVMTAPYPIEVVTQPRQVIILHEIQHLMRFIYLNEQHPSGDDLTPTYGGHSVGHWEGDTLVADTVGTEGGLTTLDQADRPKTGDIHIIEHIKKIDGGKKLEDLVTFDDPKVYTKPWTARLLYDWRPDIRFIEYICEENNRNPVSADGTVGATLK